MGLVERLPSPEDVNVGGGEWQELGEVTPLNRARPRPHRKGWWRFVTMSDRPAPGGEPLWSVSEEPAIFVPAFHPVTKCCNRRLPRITQRDAFTPGFSVRLRPVHRAAKRWDVPGSRLLLYVSAGFAMKPTREGD
jgi:hypothetical protein